MGCGQTSRVDSLKHAILKANAFGFDLHGSVMASEAFFPFPGLCRDRPRSRYHRCHSSRADPSKTRTASTIATKPDMAMIITGFRHFKH